MCYLPSSNFELIGVTIRFAGRDGSLGHDSQLLFGGQTIVHMLLFGLGFPLPTTASRLVSARSRAVTAPPTSATALLLCLLLPFTTFTLLTLTALGLISI